VGHLDERESFKKTGTQGEVKVNNERGGAVSLVSTAGNAIAMAALCRYNLSIRN